MYDIATYTVEDFVSITRVDIVGLFEGFDFFVNNYYPKIAGYYKGYTGILDTKSVDELESLLIKFNDVQKVITDKKRRFDRQDYWQVIEAVDDILINLNTINNIGKFLRTSQQDSFNADNITIDYTVSDGESPEDVVRYRGKPQTDWVDVYSKNQIKEIDYESGEGGYTISLDKQLNSDDYYLESVVDNMHGDNLYGKDFDNEFKFEDNDILVLDPKSTFLQAAKVLTSLVQGGIPEYTSLGVSQDIAVGSNLGAISIPFIMRQLRNTFSVDDTMMEISVNKVKVEQDVINAEIEIESFYNFTTSENFEVQ